MFINLGEGGPIQITIITMLQYVHGKDLFFYYKNTKIVGYYSIAKVYRWW